MKRIAMAALAVTLLSGCFAPGPRVTHMETYSNGKTLTMSYIDQWPPSWAIATDKREADYMVVGVPLTPEQLQDIDKAEHQCRLRTTAGHPNDIVAVLSNGVLYGLAGFLGVGAGSQALPGSASFLAYGQYGAAAGGVSGMANGIVTLGGKQYTFENCTREALDAVWGRKIRVLQKSPW